MLKLLSRMFKDSYCALSYDAMGVFRIVFGLVHLADLFRRWPLIELLYSNQGVLSNHYVLYRPPAPFFFSLLSAFSSPTEVRCFFVFVAFALVSFILGYRTRLAHLLCALSFLSIHQRNPLLEYGGDVVSNLFWVWTLFLPLGARCSIDSLANRNEERSPAKAYYSCACFFCLLQFSAIYFFNAWSKSGPTWVDGSALYYTLHQDRAVTALGAWVVQWAPFAALQWGSWMTRVVEFLIPLLLLVPFRRSSMRALVLVLVWALHAGIALTLNLGIFSPLMMASVLLFLEGRVARALAGSFEQAVKFCASLIPVPESSPAFWLPRVPREALVLLVGYCALSQLFVDNRALQPYAVLPQPSWVQAIIGYGRLHQGWSLFAPDAPRSDGWLVMDLQLRSGEHFDPQTGREPTYLPVSRGSMPWQQAWDSYSLRLSFDRFAPYRYELERWILERGQGLHRYDPAAVVSYQVWWLSDETPAPGAVAAPPQRRLLLEGRRAPS